MQAQGLLVSANPNPIQQGYNGNLVITGSGTNFSRATCGINLKLTHVGSGQQYNFGTAPTGAGWMPGNPWPTDLLAQGNVLIPANAPAGYYDVQLMGYEGDYCIGLVTNVTAPSFIYIGSAGLFGVKWCTIWIATVPKTVPTKGLPTKLLRLPRAPFTLSLIPMANFPCRWCRAPIPYPPPLLLAASWYARPRLIRALLR